MFAAERNPYAPIVYKMLTSSLIENHADLQLREFILRNFSQIFFSFPSIPIKILLDPVIKQL